MDGRVSGHWTDKWMDACTGRCQMEGCVPDEWAGGWWMDEGWVDGRVDGWVGGWRGGWVCGWISG